MSDSQRVIISGATGGAPNRLEINNFVKNDKFLSLYVQALRESIFAVSLYVMTDIPCDLAELMFNKDSQDNVRSFFQIGGIHGLPYIPWDGVTGNKPFNPNAQWGGYCTHGSVLFPTWHRPYVMLYEVSQQHPSPSSLVHPLKPLRL